MTVGSTAASPFARCATIMSGVVSSGPSSASVAAC